MEKELGCSSVCKNLKIVPRFDGTVCIIEDGTTLTVAPNGFARGEIKPLITLGCVFQLLLWTTLGVIALLLEKDPIDFLSYWLQ
jgi:hypothetical protein